MTLTLFEQMLNIQNYGDEGGRMNLERVRQEIYEHDAEKKRKKKEREETQTFIEKLIFDVVKASGRAVIQQAINEVIDEFNSGK